jgi:archaellum component FlaC
MTEASVETRLERIEQICERTAENIEALTQQVGVLTEGLAEIRMTTERQERNIDRLVGIVETLISRAG